MTVKRGDSDNQKLLESIYKHYCGLVYSIAKDMIGNDADAEDVVQETFFRISRNISHISGINSKTKGYVIITARSAAVDLFRKNKRNAVVDSFEDIEELQPDASDIESDFITKQEKKVLCEALMRLPSIYKEVLILKYYESLKNGEIGKILSISKETVKKRIQRGLARLRKELEKNEGD